jgi:phosphate transport system protein
MGEAMSQARIRLGRKIENIKRLVSSLGAQVVENVQHSMRAIQLRDTQLGRSVTEADCSVDRLELDLEEQCLEILALHQPVATDLRFIIGILKANHDLERIGDMAANIGRIAVDLAAEKSIQIPEDYFIMADETVRMLNKSLDSLIDLNSSLAYEVLREDDNIDLTKHKLHREYEEKLSIQPENVRALTHLFLISRHLERIADHATNIAEDVIYIVTGHIRRHGR